MPKKLKCIEMEGVSSREAIKKALKFLGATRDAVEIKVLSEEKKGLFGMKGTVPARVRITLKEHKHCHKE